MTVINGGLSVDATDDFTTGEGYRVLKHKVDISTHALRGRDIYLYRCNACGTQNLLGRNGGELPCPCDPSPGVTVTVLNQLTPEEREAEGKAYEEEHRRWLKAGGIMGKVA